VFLASLSSVKLDHLQESRRGGWTVDLRHREARRKWVWWNDCGVRQQRGGPGSVRAEQIWTQQNLDASTFM
jgi:hypothetical protein